MPSAKASLDGHGIFAIIVFAAVSVLCIVPLHIPLPRALSRWLRARWAAAVQALGFHQVSDDTLDKPVYIPLTHVTAPVIGVLLLLATVTITGQQVRAGIAGDGGVYPYDVLALFLSLAYIAISLDSTGLLRYLACHVCQSVAFDGRLLYVVLYFFLWLAGVVLGNDPVVLSGTAFLVYLTRVAGIVPPSAWIWAQFVAANVASAVLVSSNPTNLVVATGFDVSFARYTAYMVLPSLASAFAALAAIMLFFSATSPPSDQPEAPAEERDEQTLGSSAVRDVTPPVRVRARDDASADASTRFSAGARRPKHVYLPRHIPSPDITPRTLLVDPVGAVFCSVVMLAVLGTLIGTSAVGDVRVYQIGVPGAVLCGLRDIFLDLRAAWRRRKGGGEDTVHKAREERGQEVPKSDAYEMGQVSHDTELGPEDKSVVPPSSASSASAPAPAPRAKGLARIGQAAYAVQRTLPNVLAALSRLPVALLPFAFGMFILVQALAHVGFIAIMARGIVRVCAHGVGATVFFMALLSIVLCNVGGTNIGATILLTKMMQSPAFQEALGPSARAPITRAGMYATAFGSNLGALGGTFAASLAGLLWKGVLQQHGVKVTAIQFATWCAVAVLPSAGAGLGVLLAEVLYFKV